MKLSRKVSLGCCLLSQIDDLPVQTRQLIQQRLLDVVALVELDFLGGFVGAGHKDSLLVGGFRLQQGRDALLAGEQVLHEGGFEGTQFLRIAFVASSDDCIAEYMLLRYRPFAVR